MHFETCTPVSIAITTTTSTNSALDKSTSKLMYFSDFIITS